MNGSNHRAGPSVRLPCSGRRKKITPVEFNGAHNCHCSLRLETGREIILDQLAQSRTYDGLLEGTPNRASNERSIEWAMECARKGNESLGEPYLIEPERRDYLRESGDMQAILEQQHNRPAELKRIPEWLPQIECVGVFSSIQPARDEYKDASSLTGVWYQEDFGFDPHAIERLRAVNWEQHATDWEY